MYVGHTLASGDNCGPDEESQNFLLLGYRHPDDDHNDTGSGGLKNIASSCAVRYKDAPRRAGPQLEGEGKLS